MTEICVFCGRKVPPPIEAHFDREHWTPLREGRSPMTWPIRGDSRSHHGETLVPGPDAESACRPAQASSTETSTAGTDLLDTYVSEGRIEPGDAESLRAWIGARIAAAVRESAPSEDEYPVLNATKGTTLVFPDGSSVIVTTQNGRYILADHMDVVP